MIRTWRSLIAACLFCLGLSSCSSHDWSQDDAHLNMIKIHAIVPDNMPKSDLVIEMPTINNKTVKMDRIPLISNKEMVHAESDFVGENAMYIKIDLTSLGRNKWYQASAQLHGGRALMTIGGKFKCLIRYEPYYRGKGAIKFYVQLSSKETDELCSLIKKNYKALVRR